MSVSMLVVSEQCEGLFQAAISESGTAFTPGGIYSYERCDKNLKQKLNNIGKELDFTFLVYSDSAQ